MHGPLELREDAIVLHDGGEDVSATSPAAAITAGKLLFFCPDVTDASTLKRVRQFTDHGYDVTVFGFRRHRYNTDYQPDWPHVPLGVTSDGQYGQRMSALLRAVPKIIAQRRQFKDAAAFYARNIDQLLLAMLARTISRSKAPLTYEVLDIPPILMGRMLLSRLLRAVERLCLRHTHLLVLSSPGFYRSYYHAIQRYGGDWFLLENKLHPSITRQPIERLPANPTQRPWVVGYYGLIRGAATFDLMTRLAKRLEGRVVFKFRGVLTTVDPGRFDDALKRHANIVYGGPYLPEQDLENMYREVDFAWALDLEHVDHNSRWLMPCRFYEAGFFGVPCLAVHGFEVGTMVEQNRIGWTFDQPLENALVRFFETLTKAEYEGVRQRLGATPPSMFVASDDVRRLCARLA